MGGWRLYACEGGQAEGDKCNSIGDTHTPPTVLPGRLSASRIAHEPEKDVSMVSKRLMS